VAQPVALTVAERPDLAERAWLETSDAMPEYNSHGDVANVYWPRLTEERPDFQFHVMDGDRLLARCRSIPIRWDGTPEDLPSFDGALERGFDQEGANVLCALLISVPRSVRGQGASSTALRSMLELARRHDLEALVAPVRPNWKDRYPLVPIERYADWRREDGLPFDPWLRIHERVGGRIVKPEPHSLRITGTLVEWEGWTGMAFPESGVYVFPGGLSTLEVDREADVGRYWEPNIWMQHDV
jgi:hypothetical protein